MLKSTDQGQSWTSISGDLPEFGNIRAFAEHHENPNVLFVGTEIRPFVTLDGGESWVPLENGIPPSPVHDIKIHHRDNALVVATHGRGFYVIDDLNPIVHMAEAKAAGGPYLFPVADAFAYVVNTAPSSGIHAGREYRAPNPAYGAGIAYYMPEGTRGERKLEIVASDGQTVRTLEAGAGAGLQMARWDLRWDAPWSGPPANQQGGGGGFGGGFGGFGGGFGGGGGAGPPALGDQYTARLTITPDEGEPTVMERSFTVEMDDLIGMTRAQLAELQELRLRHRRLSATQQMAARQAQEIQSELRGIEAAMARVEVSDELQARADELGEQATAVLRGLRGGGGRGFGGGGGGGGAVTVQSLLGTAGGMNQTYAPATDAEKTALEEAGPALDEQLAALNELVAAMARLPRRARRGGRALDAGQAGRPRRALNLNPGTRGAPSSPGGSPLQPWGRPLQAPSAREPPETPAKEQFVQERRIALSPPTRRIRHVHTASSRVHPASLHRTPGRRSQRGVPARHRSGQRHHAPDRGRISRLRADRSSGRTAHPGGHGA